MSFDPTTRTALSPAELEYSQWATRNHHAQKQLNLDIVNHVSKYGPCGFIELYDLFGATQGDGKNATERFRTRLNYLSYSCQLVATGTAGARRWRASLNVDLPAGPTPGQLASATTALPTWKGAVVPAPRYDRIHAPAYVPERAPALRAGCQDFKRLASRGDRC